ncbi:MAG: hypothetical protein AB7F25_12320 [Deferribacterales bacterium]
MSIEEQALKLIDELKEHEAELLSTALIAYQNARTGAKENGKTANVKALEAATRQLQRLLEKHTNMESFKNTAAVHKYLVDMGYKVSKRSLYNHIDSGALKLMSGKYLKSDVDAYAENHLTLKEGSGGYAEQKIQAEIEQKNVRTELIKIELDQKRGLLVERDKVGQEFAARIATLAADLDRSADVISLLIVGKSSAEVRKIIREQHMHVMSKYAQKLESVK